MPSRNAPPIAVPDLNQPLPTGEYQAHAQEHPKILQALLGNDTDLEIIDPLENDMVLNLGPQHPATGVLRVLLRLDGETIIKAVPELGLFASRLRKNRRERNLS